MANTKYKAKKIPGIYLITNTINGKRYVGKSIDMPTRWAQHLNMRGRVAFDVNARKELYFSMRKNGISNFTFTILEECFPLALDDQERYGILKLLPEYNTLLVPKQKEANNV